MGDVEGAEEERVSVLKPLQLMAKQFKPFSLPSGVLKQRRFRSLLGPRILRHKNTITA